MSETKINASLSCKFKKTQVNSIQKLPDITGHTLGEFLVDSRLDIVSGEADIYLCSGTGSHSGKKFLLKYYRRENAVKPDVLEKLKGVNSSFVAPVEGFGEYQRHQYVVRPYYEMSALSELLAEGTRFSEEDLKTFIIPSIIEGLKAVHDAGILHKDLKPANLIPDDAGEHIVLIDFGISSDAGKNTFVMTQTGMTPFYAAPEAMQGLFHLETDYYALGITIFELFTGFTPFQNPGLSPEDVARLASISKIEFPEGFPEDLKKLVLGLTYKDISHRNEKDNPNRRWGYDEVRRWLNGEDVSVPGESDASGQNQTFLPYSFGGVKYQTQESLVKAMLKDPAAGIREVGRGILAHHFSLFDPSAERLCREAEDLLQRNSDEVSNHKVFYRLMYSLAPELKTIFCGGLEFANLTELGGAAVVYAASGNRKFCNELELLQRAFLGDYVTSVIKSEVAPNLILKVNEQISRGQYSYFQVAWILGYALSEKRNIRVGGLAFSCPAEFFGYLRKMEADKGFSGYIKYIDDNRQDLEFFAACIPEEKTRQALNLVLDDLNRAIFGNGELQFRDAEAFDKYVRELLRDNQANHLCKILNSYGRALKEVSEKVWHSASYENLKMIVSGLSQGNFGLTNAADAEVTESITVKGIKYPAVKPLRLKAGEVVKFGSYPQNNGDTKEPIEWLVLGVGNGVAFLISRYGLDCQRYHRYKTGITWDKSDLREWLNNNFLNAAFSKEEQEMIAYSKLKNNSVTVDLWDRVIHVDGGSYYTSDRIFCLSLDESKYVMERLRYLNEMPCIPTEYARKRGAEVKKNGCSWWFRSPGHIQYAASFAYGDNVWGDCVDSDYVAVRPALWLKLESVIS